MDEALRAPCAPEPTGADTRWSRRVPNAELRWTRRVPVVVGLFVVAFSVVLATERHEVSSPDWGLLIIVAVTVPWLLDMFNLPPLRGETRFTYPVLVTWSALVVGGVWALGNWYPISNDFAPFLVVILIAEMTSTEGLTFGAVLLAACIVALILSTNVQHHSGNVIWAFGFTMGFLGGLGFRYQLRITTELFEAQEQLAEQAKEDERRRLAREIHDLIAHSLAVTMLQLGGARLALRAGDTEEAIAALGDAEAAGRAAMAEVHRTVGLLGKESEQRNGPPTPSATDVPGLVDGFRQAGLDVTFDLEGNLSSVPLATGLAVYRVVQESLSNAVKHAPGAPVTLDVSVCDDRVDLEVRNRVAEDRPPAPGGNGLQGMAERAQLLGGTVVVGDGQGTWKVDAHLPWSERA